MGAYESYIAEWIQAASRVKGKALLEHVMLCLQAIDGYSDGHNHRVAQYSLILSSHLLDDCRTTYEALAIHDIGKIVLPHSIILKPGPLTSFEWAIMQKHPDLGLRLIEKFDTLAIAADVVGSHHERWDGKGYPRGLKGTQIPLISRLLSVADSFDAMTTHRPYRKAMTLEAARQEVEACSGTQFDPEVVAAFGEAWPQIQSEALGFLAA